MIRKGLLISQALTIVAVLAACGSGSKKDGGAEDSGTPTPNKNHEPIELVFASNLGMSQDTFATEIGDPVHQKFPYITPKYIERGTGTNLPDLVAGGTPPDIVWYVHSSFPNPIQSLGLDYDMSDLIKKYKYDMNRYYPQIVDTLKFYTNGKGYYGIPRSMDQYVLYYNKDLFDKFGVPYPKDGMTWDDVYEMAKKVTRQEGGVQYRGFSSFYSNFFRENQLSLSPLSTTEDKASVNNDGWKNLLLTLDKIYKIPGNNRPTNSKSITPEVEQFEKQSNVATIAVGFGRHTNFPPTMNWDLVSLPTFKEKPKTGMQTSPSFWSVTATSKYKDEAFQVIMDLMSDEKMLQKSKEGSLVPVNKPEIQKAFATDAPVLKGKNVQALFANTYAKIDPPRSPGLNNTVRQEAINQLTASFTDMLINGVDINTTLRTAEENINKKIDELNAK